MAAFFIVSVLCFHIQALAASRAPAPPTPTRAPEASADQHDTQLSDISDLDLEQLLSTRIGVGSVEPTALRDVPAVVEVMTSDQILAYGVRDLRELMQYLTGVYQRPHSGAPVLFHTLRVGGGAAAYRILLVIDDHVQVDDVYEMLRPYHIPIESIERIEFLRGPASVLYGTGAMRAVVRVVTKRGSAGGIGGTALVDSLGGGRDVSAHAGGTLHLFDAPLRVRVDVQARRSERRAVDLTGSLGEAGTHELQPSNLASLVTVTRGKLHLRLQQEVLLATALGMVPEPALRAGRSTTMLYGAELGYKGSDEHRTLNLRAGLEYRPRRLSMGRLPPFRYNGREPSDNATDFLFDSLAAHADADASVRLGRTSVGGGLSWRHVEATRIGFRYHTDGEPNPLGPPPSLRGRFDNAAAYGFGSLRLNDSLSVQGGVRADLFHASLRNHGSDYAGGHVKPTTMFHPMGQAAVLWNPSDTASVKLIYGRSFRIPSIVQIYASVDNFFLPNMELRAETQHTFAVAMDAVVGGTLTVRVDAFYGLNADAIVASRQGGTTLQYVNSTSHLATHGFSAALRWRALRGVVASAMLSMLRSRFDSVHPGLQRSPDPKYFGALWCDAAFLGAGRLRIVPTVRVRGPQRHADPTDVVVDVPARFELNPDVALTLAARNVLNRRIHSPYDGGPYDTYLERSRALRVGISARF